MTKKQRPWKGRARTSNSVIKSVKKDNFASAICPTNLEEQKERFLALGKTPEFVHKGNEEELEAIYQKPRSQIRFDLLGEAIYVLKKVKEKYGSAENYYTEAFGERVTKSEATDILIDYLKENRLDGAMTVVWCKDLPCSGRMMWTGPQVKYGRPEARQFSMWIKDSKDNHFIREGGITCLCNHEIGTHFLRSYNDGLQPWYSDRDRFGIRGQSGLEQLRTEEGLAAINTVLGASVQYLWGPALLYYIACKASEMTFKQLFEHLAKYVENPEWRWRHCVRVKRGLLNPNDIGGYGKDQCYFEGAVTILRNCDTIDFKLLMSGKLCYDECSRVKRLARLNCIKLPAFMRNQENYKKSLKKMAHLNGLHLTHTKYKAPLAYIQRIKRGRRIGDTRAALNQVRAQQVAVHKTGETSEEGDASDVDESEFYEEKIFLKRYEVPGSAVQVEISAADLLALDRRTEERSDTPSTVRSAVLRMTEKDASMDNDCTAIGSQSDTSSQYRCVSRASVKARMALQSISLASRGGNQNSNSDTMNSVGRPDSGCSKISYFSTSQAGDFHWNEVSDSDDTQTFMGANHKPFPFHAVSPGYSRTPASTALDAPNTAVPGYQLGAGLTAGTHGSHASSCTSSRLPCQCVTSCLASSVHKSLSVPNFVDSGPPKFIYPESPAAPSERDQLMYSLASVEYESSWTEPGTRPANISSQQKLLKRRVRSETNVLSRK